MDTGRIYEELDRLLTNGETEKIEPCLLSLLKQAGDGEDYASYIVIGREVLTFYRETGAYEKAFASLEDLLLLMEELGLEGSGTFAGMLIEGGAVYGEAGQSAQACRYYTQAVHIYEQTGMHKEKETTAEYAAALTGLGESCYRAGDFKASLEYYEKALEQVRISMEEGEAAAVLCENCAAVCDCLKKAQTAEEYRERAARIRGRSADRSADSENACERTFTVV